MGERTGVRGGWLVLCMLLGWACNVVDLSDVQTQAVRESVEVRGWDLPYLGRVAMDWSVRNDGGQVSDFVVQTQMQTRGSPEDAACRAFTLRPERTLALVGVQESGGVEPIGTPPVLRTPDLAVAVDFGEVGAGVGVLNLRIRQSSTWRILANPEVRGVRLFTLEGVELVPVDATAEPPCEAVGVSVAWLLEGGSYLLVVEADRTRTPARVMFQQECSRSRLVARTCAGATSEVADLVVREVAPGETRVGRIGATQLGIGNRLVLATSCTTPGCRGELAWTSETQELQCAASADCPGRRTCTEDGYCLVTAESGGGGCSKGPSGSPGLLPLLTLLVGLVLRWATQPSATRRRRQARLGSALALASLVFVPGLARAQGSNEVFMEAGGAFHRWTGAVGQDSSTGFGLQVTQGALIGRRIGFALTLGSETYLTDQTPPPLLRGLQLFTVGAGVRWAVEAGPVRVMPGLDYVNATVLNNGLVRTLGTRRNHSGVQAGLGIRPGRLGFLYAELRPQVRWLVTTRSPGWSWGMVLAVGVLGGR
jgi:hypothetical protein